MITDISTKQAIDEVWTLFKETDKQFKETDKKFKETDKKLDKRFVELSKFIEETDARLAKKIEESIGGLSKKWGNFVEYFLAPGIPRVFQERGIAIYRIYQKADKYAYKKGFFVIGQSGGSIKILNDEKFKAKEW